MYRPTRIIFEIFYFINVQNRVGGLFINITEFQRTNYEYVGIQNGLLVFAYVQIGV